MPSAFTRICAVLVPNVGIIVVGGFDLDKYTSLRDVHLLECRFYTDHLQVQSWKKLPPVRNYHQSPGIAYHRGRVLMEEKKQINSILNASTNEAEREDGSDLWKPLCQLRTSEIKYLVHKI
ncbi:hypothetical protein ACTXT7_015663 [Hymenolepis weldensis]